VKIVNQEGSTEVFERDHLMTIVEGSPKEINYWSFKFSIGLAVQQGNTDQADFNVSARIKRQTTANRLNLDFLGLISEVNGVETANNHRANASFDIFLSRRFFLRPVFAEYYHDPFVNIDHRGTLGVALGYHIIDTSRTEWDVFGGPAYQYTKFVSVQPGASSDAQTAAFIAGTKYDIELTGWLDLYAGYNFSLLNQASGTYTHHAVAGVEVELTDILDLDFGIVWDRVQNPQQRADGSTPKSNDFRMTLGLGLDI